MTIKGSVVECLLWVGIEQGVSLLTSFYSIFAIGCMIKYLLCHFTDEKTEALRA